MRKILLLIPILLIIGAAIAFSPQLTGNLAANQPAPGPAAPTLGAGEGSSPETYTVQFTSEGYVPKELTIKKGDTVKWVNTMDIQIWPASARHPTHTVYPGSNIEKCGTSEERGIFDACRGFGKGQSWSFTFNEVGSWFYHDHLTPTFFGKITVE